MNATEITENGLNLEEGYACLDFANTVENHASDHPEESLNTYPDLVNWARRVGLVDETAAAGLLAKAELDPRAADAALKKGIALREAIYHILSAHSRGDISAQSDLAVFNRMLSDTMARTVILADGEGFTWSWDADPENLDWLLAPVIRSAANLLTSDVLYRVGECADEGGCGWLFFDTSRNRSRRWCSMDSCGNRAKAKRHYQRGK